MRRFIKHVRLIDVQCLGSRWSCYNLECQHINFEVVPCSLLTRFANCWTFYHCKGQCNKRYNSRFRMMKKLKNYSKRSILMIIYSTSPMIPRHVSGLNYIVWLSIIGLQPVFFNVHFLNSNIFSLSSLSTKWSTCRSIW